MYQTGFNTALQVWIIFLILFFVLQYSATFSVLLGAIAGVAAGVIAAFMKAENQTIYTKSSLDEDKGGPFNLFQRRLRSFRKSSDDQEQPERKHYRRPKSPKSLRSRKR